MKLKGIVLVVILLLASIMMPFDVYAAVQSTIVPTFSSSTSQWSTHLSITNFSDGTNNQASSTLSFTFDDDYYGVVYFDGYGPSNQHIANFATCFVAGGYGEYRYSYYQNAVINITSVTINIVNVVKPDSSVDLTQIITLLTAIENDTSSIDNVLDSTLSEIRSILSQLIVSNGYLSTISQLRSWNIPVESFAFNYYLINQGYDPYLLDTYYNFQLPLYNIQANQRILYYWHVYFDTYYLIIGTSINMTSSNISNQLVITDGTNNATIQSVDDISLFATASNGRQFKFVKITYKVPVNNNYYINLLVNDNCFIPVYFNRKLYADQVSTDFALRFGMSNQLLDDIHLIAQGSTQSNSAASGLEQNNNQMASDMNNLATIESGYNQQFNNQLQSIDFTSPIQNNAGILPAANFVISIFNGLINNNPFSVLIIVVCILLIGKKVIGK